MIYNGARIDTRSKTEKEKDYKFEEIVASVAPVKWVEKPQSEWRKFPIFNQDGSGSCVAQTLAKLLGILYWLKNREYVHFSATHIYQRRANKPNGGMAGVDALDIAREGVTLEELVKSQNMNDVQMDGIRIDPYKIQVGEIFKIGNYVVMPTQNIDTVASIIQETGKGVMVWFYFNSNEWTAEPKVIDKNLTIQSGLRHSVTAVDFTLYKGKKCLIIEDSWGPTTGNGAGQRIVSEDFFKVRNWFAAYPISFKFAEETDPAKPTYTFKRNLKFSSKVTYGDKDVIALQNILKYEGLFPVNTESTGYFGSITKQGVVKFQMKHGIDPVGEVGPITRAKLNQLYSQ